MGKFKYNIIDDWEILHIWIKPNFDIQKWRWFNLNINPLNITYMIHKSSQVWLILNYLQKNPKKEVTGTDFLWFWFTPFIWINANCRLSELKRMWLVEIVGTKKGIIRFFFKSKPRNLYRITEKGLETKLK